MKKIIIVLFLVVVLVLAGLIFYVFNSPFSINSVKIPDSIGTYTKANVESMNGYLVTGKLNEENFIDNCKYVTYNPESSLNHVYICKPKNNPENSLNSWINSQMDFLNQGSQVFSKSEENINGNNVVTITISQENCGNPGFCTTYYWKQGRIIFSSNTRTLVEQYIKLN